MQRLKAAGGQVLLVPQNKISVALCTYNGERFLAAQLASIQQQSRLPDELICCDDRSTDESVAILRRFAGQASFPVRIVENVTTLGSTNNFVQALRLCSGDLIALCDQDDLWYVNRLERSEQELQHHPEVGLVFSDATVIDEQDQPLQKTLWQRIGFIPQRQRDLQLGRYTLLAKHRFVTGATVMVRAALREHCLPIPPGFIHDEWITMMGAAFSELRAIDQPLISYRIHAAQQVGFTNKLQQRAQGSGRGGRHWARIADSARELQLLCDALQTGAAGVRAPVLSAYREHLQFLLFRSRLAKSRFKRIVPLLSHFAQYRRHATGLRSLIKDLVL